MVTSEEVVDVIEAVETVAVNEVSEGDVVQKSAQDAVSAKLTDVKEIIAFLADKFPKCFTVEGEAKPLKIGIFRDLAEQVADESLVSRTQLRQALRRYTSSWRYLKCVAKGGLRYDLNGEPGVALEEDHISHAAQSLQESKAKFEKSRKTLKDKKFYKKSQKETGETPTKQAKFSGSSKKNGSGAESDSKTSSNHAANTGSEKAKRSHKREGKKPVSQPVELRPLGEAQKQQGTAVLVKFGHSPVPGVIQEVSKGDAHVQLNSGMVIKTKLENLFVA